MNALNQYLRLYEENRGLIDSNSAQALNSLRPSVYEFLSKSVLPGTDSENYAFTDLEAILTPDYGLNLARVSGNVNPRDSFRCDVPDLSTSLFFLINDSFLPSVDASDSLPAGVIAGSLRDVAESNPELISRYYGSIADPKNPLVALNTMLAQDGFVLYIPSGVTIEKPIQLVSIFQSRVPLMALRRVLIIADKGSEATILACDHTQNPANDYLNLQTVEIILDEDARIDYTELEESTERTVRLSSLYLRQEGGSRANINGITLFNGTTRNEYHCVLSSPRSELNLSGLAIEDCARRLDTYSLISHEAPNCRSNEMFKYVADDKSLAAFSGRILVQEGASGTEAYQSNRNLLGDEGARIYSKPQLEIYNDDVKCSHGCATGKLDEMQLFYLRARGVDEADARRMLKQAFMADVIEGIRVEAIRERLRKLVEQRFNGRISACAACAAQCPVKK